MAKKNVISKATVFTYGRPGDLYSHIKPGWLDDMDVSFEAQKIASAYGYRAPTVLKVAMTKGAVVMKSKDLI